MRLVTLLPIFFLATTFVGNSFAASAGWPEEPKTVFGMTFGKPLPFATCGSIPGDNSVCLESLTPSYNPRYQIATLRKQPYLGFSYSLSAIVNSNRVIQVRIQTDVGNQAQIYELFTKRYGLPHDVRELTANYQNAVVPYRAHFWNGAKYRIQFYESLARQYLPITEIRIGGINIPWDIPVPKETPKKAAPVQKAVPRVQVPVQSF